MFPEPISNHLASLQEGKVRYVKSVLMDFTPEGKFTQARFSNAAIRVKKRFAYEQVMQIIAEPAGEYAATVDANIVAMIGRMKELALIFRERRQARGSLELSMPEVALEYDKSGRVNGAHQTSHDLSHQLIEEFMLAANEAVARQLEDLKIRFLRRVHPAPEPLKLKGFSQFVRQLGYPMNGFQDRFEIQKLLRDTAEKPERHAIHYALLRSLKQAIYSAYQEDHYALAAAHYCHFTSPIRRYPDLTIHRLLNTWLKSRRVQSDEKEQDSLAQHCTKCEKRAEQAEREVTKLRLLAYFSERIGAEFDAIITSVDSFGFFAQGERLPIEGLVHIRSLGDDFYQYFETSHSLEGSRSQKRYRLGDAVRVRVARVDLPRRQLDLEVVGVKAGILPASRRVDQLVKSKVKPGKKTMKPKLRKGPRKKR